MQLQRILMILIVTLGSFGCRRATLPVSWGTSSGQTCDVERIWSRVLDGLSNLTDSELRRCEAACKNADSNACVGAGLMLYSEATSRKNRSEARKIFHQQCEANVVSGCVSLWLTDITNDRILRTRHGVLYSLGRLEQLCELGESHACEALSLFYMDQVFVSGNLSYADLSARYQNISCMAGSSFACTNLGRLQLLGLGVPQDSAKAW